MSTSAESVLCTAAITLHSPVYTICVIELEFLLRSEQCNGLTADRPDRRTEEGIDELAT